MKTIYLNLNHETTRKALLEREFKKAYVKQDEYEQYSSLWGRNINKTMIKALIDKHKELGWSVDDTPSYEIVKVLK